MSFYESLKNFTSRLFPSFKNLETFETDVIILKLFFEVGFNISEQGAFVCRLKVLDANVAQIIGNEIEVDSDFLYHNHTCGDRTRVILERDPDYFVYHISKFPYRIFTP